MLKLRQVSDQLHRSIPLSRIEKAVFSTSILNRLHQVLQTSTAYLTYPCARTSRFAHSVGCMHLTGLLFTKSFGNADPEVQADFLRRADVEIQGIVASDEFQDTLLSDPAFASQVPQFRALSPQSFEDSYYRTILPGTVRADYDQFLYLVLYQSLRLAGLLHDVGHPPLSHVTEFALGEIYDEFREADDTGEGNPKRQTFFRVINTYRQLTPVVQDLHEELGVRLARFVLAHAIQPLTTTETRLAFLLVAALTKKILQKSPGLPKALKSLIDSSLDADRLDYVVRDGMVAGLHGPSFAYDRLINSYQLMLDEQDEVCFVPSIQALSLIEEFFERRFNLWKYVTFHHRVVKTDGLLRGVIHDLAHRYFEDEDTADPDPGSRVIPADISGLWNTIDRLNAVNLEANIFFYIQWDDAWLFNVLRAEYFRVLEQDPDLVAADPDDLEAAPNLLLFHRLDELLSNRKHYYPLFKRNDTFLEMETAFLEHVLPVTDWPSIEAAWREPTEVTPQWEEPVSEIGDYYSQLKSYHSRETDEGNVGTFQLGHTSLRNSRGLFLVRLLGVTKLVPFLYGPRGHKIIQDAITALKDEGDLVDALAMPKNLKPGVRPDFKLNRLGELVDFREVSHLPEHLEQRAAMFPSFYVYVYPKEAPNGDQIGEWRKRFGVLLGEAFLQSVGYA